jgi:uncharacterized membrane protein YkvA (DUF1232 family)
MTVLARLRAWAHQAHRNVLVLWLAARDARTPCAARLLAAGIAAYALSPIDLIPDFVPVLGYLDDLVIVPLGVLFVLRMIPPELRAELQAAAERRQAMPRSLAAAAAIVVVWALSAGLILWWLWPTAAS